MPLRILARMPVITPNPLPPVAILVKQPLASLPVRLWRVRLAYPAMVAVRGAEDGPTFRGWNSRLQLRHLDISSPARRARFRARVSVKPTQPAVRGGRNRAVSRSPVVMVLVGGHPWFGMSCSAVLLCPEALVQMAWCSR
jgi:hypothetical protein